MVAVGELGIASEICLTASGKVPVGPRESWRCTFAAGNSPSPLALPLILARNATVHVSDLKLQVLSRVIARGKFTAKFALIPNLSFLDSSMGTRYPILTPRIAPNSGYG